MRQVTPLTRKRAFATIKIVAKAVMDGESCLTYSDLAKRLGMSNQTGQGLGDILDEAALMCLENKLPDVTSLVVTKESVDRGAPFPSLGSFVDGIWPLTGIKSEDVPVEQERVRRFDWKSVRQLGLSQL